MADLDKARLTYFYIDAAADGNQFLCDKYNIDEVPVIQIIGNNDEVIFEHIGSVEIEKIKKIASSI